MNSTVTMAWEILDRMEQAVAKVRDRLLRPTAALNQAGLPDAVLPPVLGQRLQAIRDTPDA